MAIRILVVDDNVDAALTLKLVLELGNHAVDVAHDAQAALELLGQARYDLGFFDIGMPVMDGHELAGIVRARDRAIHLVAVSGWSQPSDVARSIAAGFDEHLAKPSSSEAVLAIAQRIAKAHEAEPREMASA